uniref:Iron only hydrogenase large subunit, C-terminal domain n=1 Tax=Myoviridae sp. ctwwN25 TaxID=2825209 RepID=A0A8S5PP74_9CAUD|nr:MAG TPA: Iron only hydrogenase large subunit, C-terminal domain [Myoviridae sp. ctwwN25]
MSKYLLYGTPPLQSDLYCRGGCLNHTRRLSAQRDYTPSSN